MDNFGRYLFLVGLFPAAFLGYQASLHFGSFFGLGVVSFLVVGAVALCLVMYGANPLADDALSEKCPDDFSGHRSDRP